jgi:hypothetical protein
LVFGVGFSLFLVSIITAKNIWEYFINASINTYDILLLLFSAWGIYYAFFLSISFLLVVIKKLRGCVWTAIRHGLFNGKYHICVDSVLNARLDKGQEKYGISAKLLMSESAESARVWIIGLLILIVLACILTIDSIALPVKLIMTGLFSSIYFLYEKTIHDFSKFRKDLRGYGDYPGLLSDYLKWLRQKIGKE